MPPAALALWALLMSPLKSRPLWGSPHPPQLYNWSRKSGSLGFETPSEKHPALSAGLQLGGERFEKDRYLRCGQS